MRGFGMRRSGFFGVELGVRRVREAFFFGR
jgi:hypothetical protein